MEELFVTVLKQLPVIGVLLLLIWYQNSAYRELQERYISLQKEQLNKYHDLLQKYDESRKKFTESLNKLIGMIKDESS